MNVSVNNPTAVDPSRRSYCSFLNQKLLHLVSISTGFSSEQFIQQMPKSGDPETTVDLEMQSPLKFEFPFMGMIQ